MTAPRQFVILTGRRAGRRLAFAIWCVLVWLAGCARPLPLSVHDDREQPAPVGPDGLPDSVADACDLLELQCEQDTGAAVVLWLLPPTVAAQLTISGRTLLVGRCAGAALAVDRPATIAHELGHVLGLADVDDPANAMHWRAGPDADAARAFDADQLERAHAAADRLVGCSP